MGLMGNWFKRYKYGNTRQYVRIPAAWPIKCQPQTVEDKTQVSSTRDVSAGGFRVIMREMLPVGSRLRVEIHVPPLNRSIQIEGRVVRCLPTQGGFDLGIQFLKIDPPDRTQLNEAIERLLPRHLRETHKKAWWRKLP